MNWRAFIWYVNMAMSGVNALATALTGRYICLGWAAVSLMSWLIAEALRKPKETEGE